MTANVTWDGAVGADYYDIYIDGTKSNNDQLTSTSFSFSISGGAAYSIVVSAVNKVGETRSDEFNFIAPPAAPSGLQYSNLTSTGVTLTWKASEGAEKYKIYRYNVAVAESSSPTWSTNFQKPSTAYNYFVTAVGKGGESAGSERIYFTTPANEEPPANEVYSSASPTQPIIIDE